MKGFIRKPVAGLCLGIVLISLVGCVHYREVVDPCYPERYNAMARYEVRDMHNAQAEKGHILDQTIWNWMFEIDPKNGAPTDHLSPGGMEHLRYISRHLPSPDFHVFLQNAQDLAYTPNTEPQVLVVKRGELNERRRDAIQRFLATQTFTHGGAAWQVAVHDFAPPGMPATSIVGSQTPPLPIQGSYPKLQNNFQGRLPIVQGFGTGPSPVQ